MRDIYCQCTYRYHSYCSDPHVDLFLLVSYHTKCTYPFPRVPRLSVRHQGKEEQESTVGNYVIYTQQRLYHTSST